MPPLDALTLPCLCVCVCGVTANSALVAMCVFIVVPVDAVIVHTLHHHMVCVCVCDELETKRAVDVAFGGGVHGEHALHHCTKSSSLSLNCVCVAMSMCVVVVVVHAHKQSCTVVVVVVVVRALWQHDDRQRVLCDGWLQTHMLQRCRIATKAGIVECDWWHGFQSHALVVLHLSVLCCAAKCCGKQDHVCTEQHTQIARVCVCTPFCLLVM